VAAANLIVPVAVLIPWCAPATAAGSVLAPVWTGAYLGINAGAALGDVALGALATSEHSVASFGAAAGFNVRFGPLVGGIEGDAAPLGWDSSVGLSGSGEASLSADWRGTLRARLGVPVGPALLYATAGYGWSAATLSWRAAGGGRDTVETSLHGPVYGLGVEAYLLPRITLRIEALRFSPLEERLSLEGGLEEVRAIDASDTVVRAGLSFQFH
jgi:hypothetical protein